MLRVADSRRSHHAAPVHELNVVSRVGDGGSWLVGACVQWCGTRYGKRARLAGFNQIPELAHARDRCGQIAGQQTGLDLAAARVGNVFVRDRGRIDAGRFRQQPDQNVVGAAGRATAPRH
jgi:hypothetical protein